MNADFSVILDACVLANQRVTDLLLRLAETPRLYLPHWSVPILDEADGTLRDQLGWPPDLVTYRREQIASHFPEALLEGLRANRGLCDERAEGSACSRRCDSRQM